MPDESRAPQGPRTTGEPAGADAADRPGVSRRAVLKGGAAAGFAAALAGANVGVAAGSAARPAGRPEISESFPGPSTTNSLGKAFFESADPPVAVGADGSIAAKSATSAATRATDPRQEEAA